jgi:hypothetical protein
VTVPWRVDGIHTYGDWEYERPEAIVQHDNGRYGWKLQLAANGLHGVLRIVRRKTIVQRRNFFDGYIDLAARS